MRNNPTPRQPLATIPFNLAIMRVAWWPFVSHSIFHILFLAAPLALGLIERLVYDSITGAAPAGVNLWSLVAAYLAAGLARLVLSFPDIWAGATFRAQIGALLRRSMFAALLRRPGAAELPLPVGEALNRYSDDIGEVADFPTWLPEVLGYLIGFSIAVVVMAQINLTITLIVCLPLVLTLVVSRLLWAQLMRLFHAEARTNDRVSGFLGEILGAVQALKLAGAETGVLAHLNQLGDQRRHVHVRKDLTWNAVDSLGQIGNTIGVGIVLLLAGEELSTGAMSVGDFALFLTYIWYIADVPKVLGTFIGDYQQQAVAIERLTELIPDERPDALVQPHLPVAPPVAPAISAAFTTQPLVAADSLRYAYANGQGIRDISFELPVGSLTILTGRIGSGKTTLLRVLLGLLPAQAGTIQWHGQLIEQPALHFRPPHAGYVPQIPQLLSTSLRNNILLGHETSQSNLNEAIRAAVLEPDLPTLEAGLDTIIGPRGVRLSGGQGQRTAAARAFVRTPQLLVLDDLSSALDVETEQLLWQRIRRLVGQQTTILAVSHRPVALQHADQIITLHNGQIEKISRT